MCMLSEADAYVVTMLLAIVSADLREAYYKGMLGCFTCLHSPSFTSIVCHTGKLLSCLNFCLGLT